MSEKTNWRVSSYVTVPMNITEHYRWVSPLVLVLIFSVHWSFLVLMYWYWYWYWSNFQVLTLYWYWSRKYWVNQYQYQKDKNGKITIENSKAHTNKLTNMKFFRMCQKFFEILIPSTKSLNCYSKLEFYGWKTNFSPKIFKFRGVFGQYLSYWY